MIQVHNIQYSLIILFLLPASCAHDKDTGDGEICYLDADGDGFGDPDRALEGCDGSASTIGSDCDDGRAEVNPSAEEVCGDGLDNDCDGDQGCGAIPAECGEGEWSYAVDASGASGAAYTRVQDAIDAAASGDRICVLPGTYGELLDFGGKDIEVIGVAGWASTILDGAGLDASVVTFKGVETRAALLQGFTVTGGTGCVSCGDNNGGGLNVRDGASPTLRCLNITGNSGKLGAGVSIRFDSDPLLENVLITDNHITSDGNGGGGLEIYYSPYHLRNVIIEANSAVRGGGVFDVNWDGRAGTWENVIVAHNSASLYGGGIYGGGATIEHMLLCGNDGGVGDGWLNGGASTVRNSVIDELEELGYWGDPVTATYTRTTSISGEGNITDAPPYDCGALTGDLSAFWAEGDPFADLGDPASEPDPDGSVAGIGAFFGPYGDDWDLDCVGVSAGR